jgi:hypothetical protein
MEQKPTVGRIVHYYHNEGEQAKYEKYNGADFYPAIITQVWSDTMVNLLVFEYDGTRPAMSISHESEELGSQGKWKWPSRD